MDGFNTQELFVKYRYPLLILLMGLILIVYGVFFSKSGVLTSPTKIEVLNSTTSGQVSGETTVEIAGQVLTPGVYKLPMGSRIEDLLIISGGLTSAADRVWAEKYLNRAAKLTDGQKVFIPSVNEQSGGASAKTGRGDQTISSNLSSDSNTLININTASLDQLDSLPGIGQVYGQSIIEHRPYSNVEELLSKGALKSSVYQKVKDRVTVY